MGYHAFPTYEAPSVDMTEIRRELWLWAEPVIADRATEFYERALPNRLASTILAKRHCRLWEAVIYDQPEAVPGFRDELRRTGEKFGLAPRLHHEVNTILFEELVDIVLSRYRTSRRATKAYSLVLMSATTCLGTGRAVA